MDKPTPNVVERAIKHQIINKMLKTITLTILKRRTYIPQNGNGFGFTKDYSYSWMEMVVANSEGAIEHDGFPKQE